MGAAIMGTGIVSVALLLDGAGTLSRVLLWIALALAGALAARGLTAAARPAGRARLRAEATSAEALTGVAGPCVIGTRLVLGGHAWPGAALLAATAPLWAALAVSVGRALPRRVDGGAFLLTVGTQAPAVLAATLARASGAGWLAGPALALAAAGLALYAQVLARFDARELLRGRGDHWVTGGALAITALAVALLARTPALGGVHEALRWIAVALWGAAIAWLAPLLAGELLRPRLHADAHRWATVFPLGMYAAASYAIGALAPSAAIAGFARVQTWIAAGAWALLAGASVARAARPPRRPRPASGRDRHGQRAT